MNLIPIFSIPLYVSVLVLCVTSYISEYFIPPSDFKAATSLSDHRQARIEEWVRIWSPVPNYYLSYSPVKSDALNEANAKRDFYNPNDEYWGLPRTNGYELVNIYCSACHTLEIVMQQNMTPNRWRYTLNWMSEKQGMAQLSQSDFTTIEKYLNTHFSSAAK